MVNKELMNQVLSHITQHEDQWNQGWWAVKRTEEGPECQTAYCFAGWACVLSGHQVDWEDAWAYDDEETRALKLASGEAIGGVAQELLGLDWDGRETLFAEGNTLEDLRRIVKQYTDDEAV